MLVVETELSQREGWRFLLGLREYCAQGWLKGRNISRRGYILGKSIGVLDELLLEKDASALELAMPIPMKARDPLMRIHKKTDQTFSLEVGRQSALTI